MRGSSARKAPFPQAELALASVLAAVAERNDKASEEMLNGARSRQLKDDSSGRDPHPCGHFDDPLATRSSRGLRRLGFGQSAESQW